MAIKCNLHNLYSTNKNFKALILFTGIIIVILLKGFFIFSYLVNSKIEHKDILIVFIITVIGGAFGGYVDLYRGNENFSSKIIKEKIITGIACGCLVPLFLNTISSTLIKDAGKNTQNYYVLLGIVMIVSIFSNDFLNMMKNKIIERDEKIKELERKVETLRRDRGNEEAELNGEALGTAPSPSPPSPSPPSSDSMNALIAETNS